MYLATMFQVNGQHDKTSVNIGAASIIQSEDCRDTRDWWSHRTYSEHKCDESDYKEGQVNLKGNSANLHIKVFSQFLGSATAYVKNTL